MKNKLGRPTDYNEKYDEQARKLCLLGYTDKELADFFEVAESTINLWKLKHPSFSESIKKGREVADSEVAAKLYERAKGYKHKETKVFNNDGEIITKKITKHYPPDVAAASIWLRNRQRNRWETKEANSNEKPTIVIQNGQELPKDDG